MAISRVTEPITDDDATIRAALEDAFLPALLPALAHATGDLSILRDDLRPRTLTPGVPQAGLPAEAQAEARELALAAIRRLRDGDVAPGAHTLAEDVRRTVAWMTDSPASDEYVELLMEELAPEGEDPRAPDWRLEADVRLRVVVIGAGMSGILAAIRLQQAGIPYVILEKNSDVGGTWLENTYPGARVDVSNAFYSYSFAQRVDWPTHYSAQGTLLDYFRACAEEYGIRDNIRFDTEVIEAAFDEEARTWRLRVKGAGGDEETIEAEAVISAVGQLNRPNVPEIPGRDTFAGPSFHSARWDHSVDLTGKRVAVIGTGASAAQFIPPVAEQAGELLIFQRTPNWFVPVPHYYDAIPNGLSWLYRHVPHYIHWQRFWLFWTTTDGMLPAVRVDESWEPQERSVSQRNDELRQLLTGYIQSQFADRPDLLPHVLPTYAPASKRLILDNGIWARTLKRENVHLLTGAIREITPTGIVTEDGTEHAADVIVFGTGFQASKFLTPMRIVGRGGIELNEQWDGDARAYMGITVPNFPNFFMMYGPNTNIVVNGSIIYFSECEMRYILGCLRLLAQGEARAMDCKPDVHDAYNERIDAANRQMVWGVATVNSWYRNAKGRSAQNWPFNLVEYWRQTREPNPEDYAFL